MLACAPLNGKYLFLGRVCCQEQSQLPQLRAVVHRLEVVALRYGLVLKHLGSAAAGHQPKRPYCFHVLR